MLLLVKKASNIYFLWIVKPMKREKASFKLNYLFQKNKQEQFVEMTFQTGFTTKLKTTRIYFQPQHN